MEREEFNALVEKTAKDLMNACEGNDRRYILIAVNERDQTILSACASINQIANMLFSAIRMCPDIRQAAGIVFGELTRRTFNEQPETNASSTPNSNLPN